MTSFLSTVSSNYLPEIGDFADFSDPSAVTGLGAGDFIEVPLAFPPVFSNSPAIFCGVDDPLMDVVAPDVPLSACA